MFTDIGDIIHEKTNLEIICIVYFILNKLNNLSKVSIKLKSKGIC